MMRTVFIIDAYNVLHSIPAWRERLEKGLADGRRALLQYCASWMAQRRDVWKFYLVFDGSSDVAASSELSAPGVQVIYTPSHQTADDKILDVIGECGPNVRYTVVSADRYVCGSARHLGASKMTPSAFASTLGATRRTQQDPAETEKQLPPSVQRSINAQLRREWGIDDGNA